MGADAWDFFVEREAIMSECTGNRRMWREAFERTAGNGKVW